MQRICHYGQTILIATTPGINQKDIYHGEPTSGASPYTFADPEINIALTKNLYRLQALITSSMSMSLLKSMVWF
ncbi:hypothetical protein XSR1_180029 [Xenorhabdus szentirmaii DSM 16338]|uniref:Uncharacterized protein n=1 Tax=Xenorhabdus szentirmaii DSM 16338 TaxID=1427518 RepID=W1IXR1_9GAMM|nr:hypothetical protein XSR1_180029 [Xenorhabdus szentirmaii DSM 16338]